MISQDLSTLNQECSRKLKAPLLSEYEQRLRVLELTVDVLIARAQMKDYWAEGIQAVEEILESLPLSTFEYASLSQSLKNAVKYCQIKESGAATFELRVLRGKLQRL